MNLNLIKKKIHKNKLNSMMFELILKKKIECIIYDLRYFNDKFIFYK